MSIIGSNSFTVDSYSYLNEARNILTYKNTYCSVWPSEVVLPERFSFRTPGYPLFLIFFSLGTFNLQIVFILQNIISIFVCYKLAIFISEEVILSSNLGQVFLVLCIILFQAQFWYTKQLLTEIVFQSTLFFSLLFSFKWESTNSRNQLLYSCLLFSLAFLIKPVLLYFLPIYIFYIIKNIHGKIRFNYAIILMPILVWCGNSKLNEYQTGLFHYSSIPNINNVNYNVKYSLAPVIGLERADSIVNAIHLQANSKPNLTEKIQFLDNIAFKIIMEHPFNMVFYNLKGLIGFWVDPGRFDVFQLFNFSNNRHYSFGVYGGSILPESLIEKILNLPISIIILMTINLLGGILLLVSFIYILIKPVLRSKYLIFILIVAYINIITGGVGALRFRLEILPFLILFFSIFFKEVFSKPSGRLLKST
jgi:hypothetical protein